MSRKRRLERSLRSPRRQARQARNRSGRRVAAQVRAYFASVHCERVTGTSAAQAYLLSALQASLSQGGQGAEET